MIQGFAENVKKFGCFFSRKTNFFSAGRPRFSFCFFSLALDTPKERFYNGIMIKKDKLDSIIKKNRERQQHAIVEWENADNLHMDNDEPDLTALNELHDSIMQAYKSDKSYPASSFGGNPSTNEMLDLTLQKIIAEYNSQIVKSDNSKEEHIITFDALNFTSHYKSPFF